MKTNYTLDWIKSKYKRERERERERETYKRHAVDRKDKEDRSKLVPDKIESQQHLFLSGFEEG